ncbi:MAG: hypothetical protein J6Y37_00765 [Paludibacteraceae bacterium]|nr:hypothetical protein [Paludibacteraceae bacterium]
MWQEGTDLRLERSKKFLVLYYMGFVLTFAALICSIYFGGLELKYLIGDGILIYSLARYYKSYPDCPPITIGKYGIEVQTYLLLSWDLIDYAFVQKKGIGKNRKIILTIQFHNSEGVAQETEVYLNSYSYKYDDIERAINYWSGREIGSEVDRNRDAMLAELRQSRGTQATEMIEDRAKTLIPLFRKEYKYELYTFLGVWVATFMVLLIVGITQFPDIDDSLLPYVCIGLISASALLGSFFALLLRRRFYSQPETADLTKEDRKIFLKMAYGKSGYMNWLHLTGVSVFVLFLCLGAGYNPEVAPQIGCILALLPFIGVACWYIKKNPRT